MRAPLDFAKMHGLGNDFVVVDARAGDTVADWPALARALGDRRRGVGFDQLVRVGPSDRADLALRFWNPDGSESGACGNATRCLAATEMAARGTGSVVIETASGLLPARTEGGVVAVNMGQPRWGWRDIPLAREADSDALPLPGAPVATSMGNPHCTFFVADGEAADLDALGPATERDPLFPDRTNVQVATVLAPDRIRMRVWERGAGITPASGSSSCATLVAAARTGRAGRSATILLDGGELRIDWREDGVWMAGETAVTFHGTLDLAGWGLA